MVGGLIEDEEVHRLEEDFEQGQSGHFFHIIGCNDAVDFRIFQQGPGIAAAVGGERILISQGCEGVYQLIPFIFIFGDNKDG